MKKSTKAALLSGLLFPGIGHLWLKCRVRGTVLLLAALAAFSIIVTVTAQQALSVVDRINSGEISVDTATMEEMLAGSSVAADGPIPNLSMIVFIACWLFGIIDSYRLGSAQEEART